MSWCEASGVVIVTGRRLSGDSRRSAVWVELGRPSSNPQKLLVELFSKRSADGSHPNDCRFASLATKKWVKQTACQRSDVKHGEDVSHVFSLQSVANFEDQRPKAIARPKVEPWLKVARELSETAVTGRIGDGRKGKSWSGGKEWKPTA